MSRLLEDLICGALGYELGRRNMLRQGYPQLEPRVSDEEIIRRFLKNCSIDEIIKVWMEVNDIPEDDWDTATYLRMKADYMRY